MVCCQPGHVVHPQDLKTHHRVVLADRGWALMQVVTGGIADAGVKSLCSGFCFPPVATELHFPAHHLLRKEWSDIEKILLEGPVVAAVVLRR